MNMSTRNVWLTLVIGSIVICGSLGGLVHVAHRNIEAAQVDLQTLQDQVTVARNTTSQTPKLEREVIVLRELSSFVEETLPSTEDLTALIEDLKEYLQEADVEVESFGLRPSGPSALTQNTGIDRIGYTLTFEGGLFELMTFLSRIESDERFMAVRSFKLVSASRAALEREGRALHHIQVDIETYTYSPEDTVAEASIDGYERKRDLLVGDIGTRGKALRPSVYRFTGDRGRRDPWVDLRVPAQGEDGGPTVQEQVQFVESLIDFVDVAQAEWALVQASSNSIDRIVKRGRLSQTLARLDEELRRLNADFDIRYVPALRRFELEVLEPRDVLRLAMEEDSQSGPSRDELLALEEAMLRHLERAEFGLATNAFAAHEASLSRVQSDPQRWEIAQRLSEYDRQARTAFEFSQLELRFGGSVIIEQGDPSVIVIRELQGTREVRSYSVGDFVLPGLEVAAVRPNEVVFYFKGYELTRVY
jgi:Tfp pilus assembly protein PilO